MSATDVVEPLGVGAVRAVRTFRIGHDGGLYPVNTATMWTPGWNVATCARGRAHTPPDPDCRCGFYVYFHPEYTLDQPPARQVLAVVEVRGVMEIGTRGARVPEARIVGLWLGPKVSADLAAAVAARYSDVRVFRDGDELLRRFPLTPVDGTRGPRLSAPTVTLLRRALWTYAVVATGVGLVPGSVLVRSQAGGAVLLTTLVLAFALLAGGLLIRTPIVACVGSSAAAWLITDDLYSPFGIAYRTLIPAMVIWAVIVWRRAARPGAVVRDDRTLAAVRRWWFRLVDGP
jgi:hypothetical protein